MSKVGIVGVCNNTVSTQHRPQAVYTVILQLRLQWNVLMRSSNRKPTLRNELTTTPSVTTKYFQFVFSKLSLYSHIKNKIDALLHEYLITLLNMREEDNNGDHS